MNIKFVKLFFWALTLSITTNCSDDTKDKTAQNNQQEEPKQGDKSLDDKKTPLENPDVSKAVFTNIKTLAKEEVKKSFETNTSFPSDTRTKIAPHYKAEKISAGPLSIPLEVTGVSKRKIKYQTLTPQGKIVEVSGMIAMPDKARTELPIMIYMHGTESDKQFTYANLTNSNSELNGAIDFFVSLGLVVLLPDYIGYGDSKDTPHPYEHASSLARTGADMLEAVRYYFRANPSMGVLSNKVFITGYSEGGYASTALHKHLEETKSTFQIIKTLSGAGAYDKLEFGKQVLQSQKDNTLPFLHTYVWVLESYKSIYPEGKNIDYKEVYTEPNYKLFAENKFPFAYQGTTRLNFSRKPVELFKPNFRNQVNDPNTPFYKMLVKEDLTRWKPKAPLMLVTGDADDYVYPINTENAYKRMLAQGANVTMKTYPGKTHGTAVSDYLNDLIDEMIGVVLPQIKPFL